jgi:hypothetical protein
MRLARWLGTVWPPDITPRERGFAAHIRNENSAKPENFKLHHSAEVAGRVLIGVRQISCVCHQRAGAQPGDLGTHRISPYCALPTPAAEDLDILSLSGL